MPAPDDPHVPPARGDQTGSWRPEAVPPAPAVDPTPTVRTRGVSPGRASDASGSRSGQAATTAGGTGSAGTGSQAATPQPAGSATGRDRPAALPLPEVGEVLGGFRLDRAIGAGGMGAVYLAHDLALDRQVALKILPPEQARDPESVQRFYHEARAAARLDDENIARVYSIAGDRGYHFIAFELVEGTTLREQVDRRGPLPPAEVVSLALQVTGGLVHAAERGLVHRDIKPSNIIVTPQGRAKLVDMGLARRFERGGPDDGLTQSGMTLGTFDYISPEQARDPRSVDVRSDLYSLGCTLFHLLAGRPPFPEGTVLQKLLQHQEEPAPDLRAVRPSVPASLAALVRKLMEKDRDRRYQTPQQLVRDLQTLAVELGLPTTGSRVEAAPTSPAVSGLPAAWERHLIWAVPALGLLLLGTMLLWWTGTRPSGPDLPAGPRVGREGTPPTILAAPGGPGEPATTVVKPGGAGGPIAVPDSERAAGPGAALASGSGSAAAERPGSPAREIPVSSRDDLRALLAAAPSGATLELTDDGPYIIRSSTIGRIEPERQGRELTIRAAATARPVVVMDRPLGLATSDATLLTFRGGRVRVEGLEFRLEPGDRSGPNVAIVAEDTDLELRGCQFRTAARTGSETTSTALLIRASGQAADGSERTLPVRLRDCHFDGGQVGIRARGPIDLSLVECTLGPAQPAIHFDNANAELPIPAFLTLRQARILAGVAPVLRLVNTAARFDVEATVIATGGPSPGTLVATDAPETLDWRGRDNIYGGIGTFLQPTGAAVDAASPVRDFGRWSRGGTALREIRSLATSDRVWASPDPLALLASADPGPAFALTDPADLAPAPDAAPRRILNDRLLGPNGLVTSLIESARQRRVGGNADQERTSRTPARPGASERSEADPDRDGSLALANASPGERPDRGGPGASAASRPTTGSGDTPGSSPSGTTRPDPMDMAVGSMPPDDGDMEPMTQMPMPAPESSGSGPRVRTGSLAGSSGGGGTGSGAPVRADEATGVGLLSTSPRPGGDPGPDFAQPERPERRLIDEPRGVAVAEPGASGDNADPVRPGTDRFDRPVRTASEFQDALRRLGSRGGTIRVAAEADLNLGGVALPRGGPWRIQAEARGGRPRLRFRPPADAGLGPNDQAVLFAIPPGTALELEGLDLQMDRPLSVQAGRLGLFAVGPGAELTLARCSLTLPEPILNEARTRIAVVHVDDGTGPDGSAATIRLTDSLVRCGRDGFDVAPGRRLDLSLTQCAVFTGGSLVHGHGQRPGWSSEPLRIRLRSVSARLVGGLVRLDSDLEAPNLPLAEVRVAQSLLATSPEGGPLVVVQGQDGLATLRDRVSWEGSEVFYHQIETYRRDQSAGQGGRPNDWRRGSWEQAFGGADDGSRHGDARFARTWDPERSAWAFLPEDLRLSPDSPALDSGADLDRIPSPNPGNRR